MPFCRNCGSPVEGQFCPKCGTPLAAPDAGASAPPPPPPPPPGYQQPAGAPPPQAASGGLTDNVASFLCYLVGIITGILFLVLEPYNKNKNIRFHAFQSIFFGIAIFALWIISFILDAILGFIPVVGWILMILIHLAIALGGFIVWIMLMVKAYQGQKWVLPIVGPLAEKQA
jgi:uncharacterized membrane protein